jgi:hypothetical protein
MARSAACSVRSPHVKPRGTDPRAAAARRATARIREDAAEATRAASPPDDRHGARSHLEKSAPRIHRNRPKCWSPTNCRALPPKALLRQKANAQNAIRDARLPDVAGAGGAIDHRANDAATTERRNVRLIAERLPTARAAAKILALTQIAPNLEPSPHLPENHSETRAHRRKSRPTGQTLRLHSRFGTMHRRGSAELWIMPRRPL